MMIFKAFFKQEPNANKQQAIIASTGQPLAVPTWVNLPLQEALKTLMPARQALWQENNPQRCLCLLPVNPLYYDGVLPTRWVTNLLIDLAGEAYLASQQYERAAALFQRYGLPERAGWAWILAGKFQQAFEAWHPFLQQAVEKQEAFSEAVMPVYTPSPLKPVLAIQADWLVTQWALLTNQFQQWPSVLQLRNTLENDVMQLVQANQLALLDVYLSKLDWFVQVNVEVYKLVGRSLFYLGWFAPAHRLLLQGQATVPMDAEVYFHLGQYYVACKQAVEAKLMLRQCLWINPTYQPAQALLASL